jgi:cellulose synthase/poly-beta-1,6-N-acetylglucosamine synthase-like glycosyltransferase
MQIFCITVFVLATFTILYALFGYPLLLGLIAKRHNHPIQKDEQLRSVSLVMAVRNGEAFLERKLNAIFDLNYPRELMEIFVVSDGSTDGTDAIGRRFESQGVRFLRVPHGGKPAALNAAVPLTTGEILIMTDVRQTFERDSLRKLIANFGDPTVGAVSGELHIVSEQTHEEFYTDLYWRYELWMRKQMTRIDSSFGCTGAFYGLRRSLWKPFPPNLLLDDAYLPLTAFFKGYRIVYEPEAKMYDYPSSLNSEFDRKLRRQAGLYQLLKVMPELFSSRNRMRLHFLSGKYGRTIVPYCLILIALSTFGLPPGWRLAAALGQLVFYGLAALDVLVPSGIALKRVTSPFRTFVVLMTCALFGVKVFFVPPQRLWKETTVRVSES